MRNQIAAAERMGVRAERITSDNVNDWSDVEKLLVRDDVDVLLIAPERLANEHFRDEVLAPMAERIALLVIDEAHCISDWGHDFRPDYRLIERIARTLPPNLRLLATTATANDRVMERSAGSPRPQPDRIPGQPCPPVPRFADHTPAESGGATGVARGYAPAARGTRHRLHPYHP